MEKTLEVHLAELREQIAQEIEALTKCTKIETCTTCLLVMDVASRVRSNND